MSLGKSVFYTFLTQIPTLILGILVGIFTTRMLGPGGKGVYAIFQSDLAIFVLFLGLNIDFGISYFISNKKFDPSKMLGLGLIVALLGIALFSIMLIANSILSSNGGFLFPSGYNSLFFNFFLILGFSFMLLSAVLSAVFRGQGLFRYVNQANLINAGFNFATFALLFLINQFYDWQISVRLILSLTLLVLMINTLVWLVFHYKFLQIKPTFSWQTPELKLVANFLIISYISQLINLLNYRFDFYVLEETHTDEQVGLYALTVNITQMLSMVTSSIIQVLQPVLNNPKVKNRNEKLRTYSRLHFTILGIASLLIIVCSGIVIPFVYGSAFSGSVLLLNMLLIGSLFAASGKIFAVHLVNSGLIKYNLYSASIGLILTICLDLLLIPTYGPFGAVVATNVVFAVVFALIFYFTLRKTELKWGNYFIFLPSDIKLLRTM